MANETWTSRSRVEAALNHREPDRVPYDLGGTVLTGINQHAYRRLRRFLGRLHIGNQQGLHADIEKALDQHHVVPRRAHDRRGRVGRGRLQLGDHVLQVVGRVLGIEQQPRGCDGSLTLTPSIPLSPTMGEEDETSPLPFGERGQG